jgi:AcrR family transcriptional regulator
MSPKDTARLQARREATQEEILHTAWAQIGKLGAASLSLRGIAQTMGLTAPALYRYFPSRDELVTAMIIEAYESLGDALEAPIRAMAAEDHARRYLAVGLAYREWALARPERFALIFGTPIPGYHAPLERTLPAASRALGVLMAVLQAAWEAGRIQRPPILGASLQGQLQAWKEAHALSAHPVVLYLTLTSWARVHGLTTLELHGHVPPQVADPAEVYLNDLHALRSEIGLSI